MLAPIILSIGAIYALIPLAIIVILIAGAAGLSRGASIFQFFGFDALVGLSGGIGAGAAGKGISKAARYQGDKTEQLLDVMKEVHASRTGMQRGTRSREVVLFRKNQVPNKSNLSATAGLDARYKRSLITRMASDKEKAQAITAAKSMGINVPEDKKAWTKKELDLLMGQARGSRTALGKAVNLATTIGTAVPVIGGIPKAIEKTAAYRSRAVEKSLYTGGSTGSVGKTRWDDETKSLAKRISESKATRDYDKRDKAAKAMEQQLSQSYKTPEKLNAEGSTLRDKWASSLAEKRIAFGEDVASLTSGAGIMYQLTRGLWNAEARKALVTSYTQPSENVDAGRPLTLDERFIPSTVASGENWSWSDYAKQSLKAFTSPTPWKVVTYESFMTGLTQYDKTWAERNTESGRRAKEYKEMMERMEKAREKEEQEKQQQARGGAVGAESE